MKRFKSLLPDVLTRVAAVAVSEAKLSSHSESLESDVHSRIRLFDPSWPGSSRPSRLERHCVPKRDARVKRAHDNVEKERGLRRLLRTLSPLLPHRPPHHFASLTLPLCAPE